MVTIKPSKQRRMVHQAPDHVRYKMFAAPLSDPLIASQGVKTLPVRSGDTIRVMRGDHKGFEGKITRVSRREYRVYVEGLTREKTDGTAVFVALHPSKVMITTLNLDDKWRKKIIERKKGVAEKAEKAKPARRKAPEKIIGAPQPVPKPLKIEGKKVAKEEVAVKEEPKKAVGPRRKTTRKRAPKQEAVKEPEEEEPKTKPKRTRSKRKAAEKSEGGE
jgi:large subunit ribosomal protein L24